MITGFRIKGAGRVGVVLEARTSRTIDLRPALREIDADVSDFFRRQFESSGAAGGKVWAPLKAASARERLRRRGGNRGGVGRPLWDFGRLKASFEKAGPESIRVIGRRSLIRGSIVPYAHFHNDGEGNMPVREIVPDRLPKERVRGWATIVHKYLAGSV